MNSFLTSLPILLPIAQAWAEKQEMIILEEGLALGESQVADARRVGVVHPEKIRVLRVESLPHPENEDTMFVAKQIGLFSSRAAGLTVGYGICVRYDCWDDRAVLVHEMVHVGQYERMGGIRPFLAEYLRQCIDPGYPFGRLEQEALLLAREMCKLTDPERPRNGNA